MQTTEAPRPAIAAAAAIARLRATEQERAHSRPRTLVETARGPRDPGDHTPGGHERREADRATDRAADAASRAWLALMGAAERAYREAGISDPRRDKRIDFVGGIRGLTELEKRVNSGEMAAAFSLFATRMEDLMAVADANEVMPPKSTWFEPKLADGMVSHMLD